jgi:hypothetical protein
MKKIPKYKTDPEYALKYARRKKTKLPDDFEKVFTNIEGEIKQSCLAKKLQCAVEYAIYIKKERLTAEVEKLIFEYYCTNSEWSNRKVTISVENAGKWTYQQNDHYQKNYLDPFFKYLKLIKTIPKKYEEDLLKNLEIPNLVYYANVVGKRLTKEYENLILEDAIKTEKVSQLVEYSYAIGSRLPEDMHNFLLFHYLKDKNNIVLSSYFINLKNIKNQLEKISCTFDETSTIKEIINQL